MKRTLNLRLPPAMIAQLENLAKRLDSDDDLTLRMGPITRSLAARLALARGMMSLETENTTPQSPRIGWRTLPFNLPDDLLERAERLRPIVGHPITVPLSTVLLEAVERGLRNMERIHREKTADAP